MKRYDKQSSQASPLSLPTLQQTDVLVICDVMVFWDWDGRLEVCFAHPLTPFNPSILSSFHHLTDRCIGNVWWNGVLRLGWSNWGLSVLWLPPCLLFFLVLFLPTNRKVLQSRMFRTIFWWYAENKTINKYYIIHTPCLNNIPTNSS